MLSSNINRHMSPQMVNFGLAAEIVAEVWGSPANFNGFRGLAAPTSRQSIGLVSVSQTLRR